MSKSSTGSTSRPLKMRLYVMMFLQYFVQGSFLPVISKYLQDYHGFGSNDLGTFGAAIAVGPLLAPFIVGQLVDRHMATEKVLAISHVLGGGVMLALYYQPQGATFPIILLGTIYSILYFPTLMLTNSLTFHHLADRDREFPLIRLWGTIGFVVPAWAVELYFLKGLDGAQLDQARGIILMFSAVSGLAMGIYSLFLPHTPPVKSDKKEFAPGKVIGLLTHRNFFLLVLVSLVVALAHKYYFVWHSPFVGAVLTLENIKGAYEQRVASIGQIFEVVVMAFLGWSLKKYGFKLTMTVGTIAYVLRCLIFAVAIGVELPPHVPMTLVCLGTALHGVCFGCFLAAAYIYVDHVAPIDVRGSMQTLYGTFVVGTGFFFGGLLSGWIGHAFSTLPEEPTVRQKMGIVSTVGMVEFEELKEQEVPAEGDAPAQVEKVKVTKVRDWPGMWLAGGGIAFVAMVLFVLLFPKQIPEDEKLAGEVQPSA